MGKLCTLDQYCRLARAAKSASESSSRHTEDDGVLEADELIPDVVERQDLSDSRPSRKIHHLAEWVFCWERVGGYDEELNSRNKAKRL